VFLPQHISRTLFSRAVSITILLASIAIARAENLSARKLDSHPARNQQLICDAAGLQFGEVVVGRASSKLVTIINRGRTSLTVLSAASTRAEFQPTGLDLPLTLAAGESFTFRVVFAPQRSGAADGSISIVPESPKQSLPIQLAGAGRAAGQLQVTPAAIDFGDASVGSPRTQSGQLIASGANVTVSSAAISSENFQLSVPSLPFTISAGHSVPFTVTFVPHRSSSSSAILSFASDAENSPTEQALTVPMIGPAQHKVQLSWKASTSKHILGYNVYRGNQSGGPYKKINGMLDPNTKFTDLKVAAGHKYYYVATAVNSRKRESRHSKQIQVVIP
jgi:hypothetical protein